jgi:HAD superfamily hydrolase (TIGR01509 family)
MTWSTALQRSVDAILCDADGTLFPSEEPAFVASAAVTQAIAEHYGLTGDFSPEALRKASTGRNFRATTVDRLNAAGVGYSEEELEGWTSREKEAVTAHLARTLVPNPDVAHAVKEWAQRYRLAIVSSSAMSRLDACFTATELDEWFPKDLRFSAEDSLHPPISKPDPAIYLHALQALGCTAEQAVAIEDSVSGASAAIAAGIPTLGIVEFAGTVSERDELTGQLLQAGVLRVARSWRELETWL